MARGSTLSEGMLPFELAPEFGSAGPQPDYDVALVSYLEYVTEFLSRRLAEGMPSLREHDRHRERLTGG
jgi:hypothetical protein